LRFHDALSLTLGASVDTVNPKVAKEKPMYGWRGYSLRLEGGAEFFRPVAEIIYFLQSKTSPRGEKVR